MLVVLRQYLRSVIQHWVALVTGSLLAAGFFVLGVFGVKVAVWLGIASIVGAVFVAQFRAWRDEHRNVEKLRQELASPESIGQQPVPFMLRNAPATLTNIETEGPATNFANVAGAEFTATNIHIDNNPTVPVWTRMPLGTTRSYDLSLHSEIMHLQRDIEAFWQQRQTLRPQLEDRSGGDRFASAYSEHMNETMFLFRRDFLGKMGTVNEKLYEAGLFDDRFDRHCRLLVTEHDIYEASERLAVILERLSPGSGLTP